jgi:hypothetical protein
MFEFKLLAVSIAAVCSAYLGWDQCGQLISWINELAQGIFR